MSHNPTYAARLHLRRKVDQILDDAEKEPEAVNQILADITEKSWRLMMSELRKAVV